MTNGEIRMTNEGRSKNDQWGHVLIPVSSNRRAQRRGQSRQRSKWRRAAAGAQEVSGPQPFILRPRAEPRPPEIYTHRSQLCFASKTQPPEPEPDASACRLIG
jgi:hypothetical protein